MSKQKYEQEIEDILRKYDEEKGKREKPTAQGDATNTPTRNPVPRAPIDFRAAQNRRAQHSRSTQRGGFTMPDWKRLSAAQYIAMAIGAAVLAVIIGPAIPIVTGVLVILSAILFFVPFVLYKNTGTTSGGYSPTEEKRWRGQKIDYTPHDSGNNDDPLDGVKKWFKKR
ncbi:MAG: hypothetical protein ABIQ44_02020 [Chloroflexia bacterium]